MEMKNDKVLEKDLKIFAENNKQLLSNFNNQTILVSGATGLVGSQFIKALLKANKLLNLNVNLIGLARNEKKAKQIFAQELNDSALQLVYQDIINPIKIENSIDYIIHGASITASKLFKEQPVEVIKISIDGTFNMLNLAKEKKVKSFIYLSSMEMYGTLDDDCYYASEKDLGYLDILNTRSCYSEGKRMCENICVCYAKEYGVNTKIARLAQTFGSGVDYQDNRIFAQFAKSVIDNNDIVLKTKGESYGNYCFTLDVVSALLIILLKGEQGSAYNIANEETNMQIKDMANLVAHDIAHDQIKVLFEISEKDLGFAPDVKLKLNTSALKALGWKPTLNLKEMYEHLIASFKAQRGIE